MGELSRGERLQIMLSHEELRALDDWRFDKRMPSRASAVRELLRRGLAADGFTAALAEEKSKDFGVVSSRTAGRNAPQRGGRNGSAMHGNDDAGPDAPPPRGATRPFKSAR
jgi:hypothetical protein